MIFEYVVVVLLVDVCVQWVVIVVSFGDCCFSQLLLVQYLQIIVVDGGVECVDLVFVGLQVLLEVQWVLVYDVVCFCLYQDDFSCLLLFCEISCVGGIFVVLVCDIMKCVELDKIVIVYIVDCNDLWYVFIL